MKNLCLDVDDVVAWCVQAIMDEDSNISLRGKNWYIRKDDCEITVNAYSHTIITAHGRREQDEKRYGPQGNHRNMY
jgi:predicted ATP-binding protein involved in virulence